MSTRLGQQSLLCLCGIGTASTRISATAARHTVSISGRRFQYPHGLLGNRAYAFGRTTSSSTLVTVRPAKMQLDKTGRSIASVAASAVWGSVALVSLTQLTEWNGARGGGGAACSGFWGFGGNKEKKGDDEVDDFDKKIDKAMTVISEVMNDKKEEDPLEKFNRMWKGVQGALFEQVDQQRNVPAEMSFGFVMGGCCGFAAKKTGKVAMVGVGAVFMMLQALSYYGFLTVDYSKLEEYFTSVLDLNKNGKVDGNDVKSLFERAIEAVNSVQAGAIGLPAGSGFAGGAVLGFRYG